MRNENGWRVSLGLATVAGLLAASGCYELTSDCSLFACGPLGSGASSSSGTSSSSGASSSSGGDSGPPPSCIPSENMEAVADGCGVFVSSTGSDATGKGTQAAPYGTLTKALTKGSTLYACAGATPFSEQITVPAGTQLYGGLDCSSWKYVGDTTKTSITAGAGQVPVTLAMGSGAKLVDLHVLAADVSMMNDGTSSIAVVANGATAEIDGCVLEAQGAAAGAAGAAYSSAAQAGMTGSAGTDACMGMMVFGGGSVMSGCGTTDSISGAGGIGQVGSGGAGSPGSPGITMNGGAGEVTTTCTPGTVGDSGTPGVPSVGATGIGSIASGSYTGVTGKDGQPGTVGQGGGGGGGAKGGTGAGMCSTAGMAAGASGGSGGSGGCGGVGGKGGGFGGSSIALASLDALLMLTNVTLKAGNGGAGGDGGPGQSGGSSGMQGAGGKVPMSSSLHPGCDGGPGGMGGPGGKGGGGTGGHSLGIALMMGTAPAMGGWTATTETPGPGGKGDDTMGNMGDGAAGMAKNCWDFVSNASCD
jgi:hypothetical protein